MYYYRKSGTLFTSVFCESKTEPEKRNGRASDKAKILHEMKKYCDRLAAVHYSNALTKNRM